MDPFLLFKSDIEYVQPLALEMDEFACLPAMRSLETVTALAVAVSGGPDSMALLALVYEWAAPRNIKIHALTIDHALRVESAAEAQKVGEWISEKFPAVTHSILRRDPDTIPPTKLQEQARHDRYDLMSQECLARKIDHLLLAHHRDDQAETFLFRLCKGSGLDGLAAMNDQALLRGVTLVRPLLSIDKERLVATCTARGLLFVKDPSNKNDKFARVRLRQVMSLLAREGLSAKRLALTAERVGRAREALDHYEAQVWDACLLPASDAQLVFDLPLLAAQPVDIRIRVLMRALDHVSGQRGGDENGYGPRLERVETLSQDIFAESDGAGFTRTTLHHCIVERSAARGTLIIRAENL